MDGLQLRTIPTASSFSHGRRRGKRVTVSPVGGAFISAVREDTRSGGWHALRHEGRGRRSFTAWPAVVPCIEKACVAVVPSGKP